ncbi:hypothetical protein ACFPRL_14795 [Pseudoclavibacter helvolus]
MADPSGNSRMNRQRNHASRETRWGLLPYAGSTLRFRASGAQGTRCVHSRDANFDCASSRALASSSSVSSPGVPP